MITQIIKAVVQGFVIKVAVDRQRASNEHPVGGLAARFMAWLERRIGP